LETNNLKNIEPNVWLCGYKYLYSDKSRKFTDLKTMILEFFELEDPVIYYHNGGRFDFYFLFDILFKSGFIPIENKATKPSNNLYFTIKASNNICYDIHLYYKKKIIIFRDSLRLIPSSIEKLGGKSNKIDFSIYREYKSIEEIEEKENKALLYLDEDLDTMANALKSDMFYGTIDCKKELLPMTLASYGLQLQKKTSSFIKWNITNCLTVSQWDYFINLFKGGLVYCNPKYKRKKCYGNFRIYDFNSLYPWVLWYYKLPFGAPHKTKPKNIDSESTIKVFIKKAKLKDKNIPYIADTINGVYEYWEEKENFWYQCWEFEWEYIKTLYDIEYEEKSLEQYWFMVSNYLSSFIMPMYQKRLNYKESGDWLNEYVCKITLNGSGFGKHGQKRKTNENYFRLVKDNEKIRKNSRTYTDNLERLWIWDTRESVTDKPHKLSYNPLASYCTARARIKTHSLWNLFYDYFVYGDTDSIIIDFTKKIPKHLLDKLEEMSDEIKLGYLKYNPNKDSSNKFYCYASKKYWFNDKIKIAGFTLDKKIDFDTFCDNPIFYEGKTFINYINGKPNIEKRDGKLWAE